MNIIEVKERLQDIKKAHRGGDFDYNTMFKVDRDAREARKLVKSIDPAHPAIAQFDKAIVIANSKTKEEDYTKREAVGSLEYGIQLFDNTGQNNTF